MGMDRKSELAAQWRLKDPVYQEESRARDAWWIDFTNKVHSAYEAQGAQSAMEIVAAERQMIMDENGFTTEEAFHQELMAMFLAKADRSVLTSRQLVYERLGLLDILERELHKLRK